MSSAWTKCGAENGLLHMKPCTAVIQHPRLGTLRTSITIQHPRLGTLRVPRCGRTERLRRLSAPQKTSEPVRRASSPSGFHQFSEKYPSWPKGHPWKGCRRLIAAQGFKSLLLRSKKKNLCIAQVLFFVPGSALSGSNLSDRSFPDAVLGPSSVVKFRTIHKICIE